MTAFDDKITAGFGYWRNGAQGSSFTAAILSRECPLWVKSRHRNSSVGCPLYPRKRTSVDSVCLARSRERNGVSEVEEHGTIVTTV